MKKTQAGFTLIEITIALVIIAFIAGGVLAGQHLLAVNRNRALITEMNTYESAIALFKDSYECLPGDCLNGTQHFPGVLNGDGNGVIVVGPELYQVWTMLALAGLIDGSYTGLPLGGVAPQYLYWQMQSRVNVPASSYTNVHIRYNTLAYYGISQNGYSWGTDRPSAVHVGDGEFLPATDIMSLDVKYDDGQPGVGRVRGDRGYMQGSSGCYTSSTQYDVTANTKCMLVRY